MLTGVSSQNRRMYPGIRRLTGPKQELTYAFPILVSASMSPKGLARTRLSQYFSLEVLGSLCHHGVISAATNGL
ncbi:hypothetical protein K469DRAFT_791469 [Zopfia rhizophila CBS 207.26]|uniref:Uncharacterized protein n=1 Tax=Zopfia rhizophila CBS 207.26 TaxID=1314779 RepID=A0A6A6DVR2_9PEZI|nr:hypothetical protein K469DRAFT_791469 [Zopfia rhizophila CBS 207.26]